MSEKILVVDDEAGIVEAFRSLLSDEGYSVKTASSIAEALKRVGSNDPDLVLLDLSFPGESGLAFMQDPDWSGFPPVLVVSGQSDIPTALEAVKLGAIDYLEKPVAPERLLATVRAALLVSRAARHQRLRAEEIDDASRLIGESPVVRRLLKDIDQVGPSDTTVLVRGENGTGKELIATRLYLQSRRRQQPFIKVNCPGIPETLFESELFGHRKGSFTGAVKDYPGKFRQADGGTIFLDEIGDLPLACQAKLLRVLETGEVETLGETKHHQVDVRVICATNRNLEELIAGGKFRQDLFYRVSVFELTAPPLASRRSDIPLLAAEFLRRFDPSGKTNLAPEAMSQLVALEFPGNVRQLKNIIERLTIFYPGRQIGASELAGQTGLPETANETSAVQASLADRLQQFERQTIEQALRENGGNISKTARALKTDRANLSRKIKQFGLKAD